MTEANATATGGLLVDTNLLVLLVVGSVDLDLIGRFKRTANHFERADYHLLDGAISGARRIVVTPHVLAEVSNLINTLTGAAHSAAFARLAILAQEILWEVVPSSSDATRDVAFERLGLADSGLALVAAQRLGVITSDGPLYRELLRRGHDVINFNHLRARYA